MPIRGRIRFCVARDVLREALCQELLEYSRTRASGQAKRGIGEDQARSPICGGIVRIGERAGTDIPEEIGIVRHEMSAVTARDKGVTQRMIQARLLRSSSLVEVAWILVEQRGKDCMAQEVTRSPSEN